MIKRFKRAWRKVERASSKVTNVATLGLHNKTKKIRHKIIKSKPFRYAAMATAVYFTAGAAMGAMGMGAAANAGAAGANLTGWAGAKAGLANAGSQLAAAGSAAMKGNFSQAGSALKSGAGFGGAGGGGAATKAAMDTATKAHIPGDGIGPIPDVVSKTTSNSGGLLSTVGNAAGTAWNSLGGAGKAAVITGGMQMAGSAMEGRAEEKRQQEMMEAQQRRLIPRGDYGLMQIGNMERWQPPAPANTTLDDLIKRQRQTVASQNFGG